MTPSKALPVSAFCKTVPVVSPTHQNDILKALHHQQQTGILCDVNIVIEHEKVPAHKAVLAASSKYFSALFETGNDTDITGSKAGNVREIVLSSVPQSTFFPILHFMYTSALHVFKENVADIMNTARKLQINSIVEMCTKITEDHIMLPSFKDKDDCQNHAEDCIGGRKDDILYVDLGQCDGVLGGTVLQSSSQRLVINSGTVSPEQAVEPQPQVQSSSVTNSFEVLSDLAMISPSSSVSSHAITDNPLCSEPPNEATTFACAHCSKSFKKKANLKRHTLIKHSSLHKFVCPKCGKRYAIEQSLQYHMSTSKCSKKSSPQHTPSVVPVVQQSDVNSHFSVMENSNVTDIPGYLSNEAMIDSGMETLNGSSIIPQSLATVNPVDSISLIIPTTTLFPSLASIHDDAMSTSFNHLEALNNIVSERSKSPDLDPKETFMCSSTSFASDEDSGMPTIKNVQSIKSVTNYTDSQQNAVEYGCTVSESPSNATDSCFTVETSNTNCTPDTTTTATSADCLEIGNEDGAPKLIRIAPKTPLMMPLRRQQKHKIATSREKVPVVIRSPVTISSLSSSVDLNSTLGAPEPAPHESCMAESQVQSSSRISDDSTHFNVVGKCLVCGRAFHCSEAFLYHKRQCCKCPFCNRIFSQFSNMKRHVGIFHTKLKPHQCSICGRAYGIKQSLRFHMEAKHGIPYVTRKYNRNVAKPDDNASQPSSS